MISNDKKWVVDGSMGHTIIRRAHNGEAVARLATGGTIEDAELLAAAPLLLSIAKQAVDSWGSFITDKYEGTKYYGEMMMPVQEFTEILKSLEQKEGARNE